MSRLRFRESGILLVLIGLGALLWAVAPRPNGESAFLNRENLFQVMRAFSFIGTAAVGATMVIVAGGIDLSVGSLLGLTVVVAALLLGHGVGVAAACAGALAVATGCGALNGALIAGFGLPPFIVTLGMLSMARGAAYWLTGGQIVSGLPDGFVALGQGTVLGVPTPVLLMLATTVAGAVLMRATVWGRALHALGGGEEAARLSGLSVARLKIAVYAAAGLTAGLAGLAYVARFGYGSSTAGIGYELEVISAVVIGGTSLSGGDGSVAGSLLGAAVMGLLDNGLTLLSVPQEYNQFVVGAVIVAAVMLDQLRSRKRG